MNDPHAGAATNAPHHAQGQESPLPRPAPNPLLPDARSGPAPARRAMPHRIAHTRVRRTLAAAIILAAPLAGGALPATAGSEESDMDPSVTYAGLVVGSGRSAARLVDADGFANWGNPGSTVDYDDAGPVRGVLAGRTLRIAHTRFRLEMDATFANVSATTTDLDPTCPDEAAGSELRWTTTLRAGVEESLGPATVFATAGLAAAGITNSVTDTDYRGSCLEMELRFDPDDSFRDSSTEFGWVIGAGMEAPLAEAWTLRVDGSYMDFGSNRYLVNRSGNNPCGPGGARRSCAYDIENRFAIVRVGLVYRFGE